MYVLKICHSLESFNGHKIAMSRVTYIHVVHVQACSNQAHMRRETDCQFDSQFRKTGPVRYVRIRIFFEVTEIDGDPGDPQIRARNRQNGKLNKNKGRQ